MPRDLKNFQIHLRVTEKENEKLEELADWFKTSKSELILIAVDVLEQTIGGVDIDNEK